MRLRKMLTPKVVSPLVFFRLTSMFCEISDFRSALPRSYVLVAMCRPLAYSSSAEGARLARVNEVPTW